ncbi:hypothetical protein T12_3778 [Trichinella patagoniensis]|uniref:Uncharacterized protein n=1 Tax=Trichinella patagoniensis TaxID=990121 RepID=A0A0V1A0H2_9BILA|nr:hypothetical protein T12_10052 [Trichinella patagoniensis]KRY18293.1 hypothetical protein T12_3778 [Trichinella patagoniensis]
MLADLSRQAILNFKACKISKSNCLDSCARHKSRVKLCSIASTLIKLLVQQNTDTGRMDKRFRCVFNISEQTVFSKHS